MVWFQCEDCGDTLKKPKVKGHAGGRGLHSFAFQQLESLSRV
jgi:cell growth-regulating nucleolar protein